MDIEKLLQQYGLKATQHATNYLELFQDAYGKVLVNHIRKENKNNQKIDKSKILAVHQIQRGISADFVQEQNQHILEETARGINATHLTRIQIADPTLSHFLQPKNSVTLRLPHPTLDSQHLTKNYSIQPLTKSSKQ